MRHFPGFLKIVKNAKRRIRETSVAAVQARQSRARRFALIDVREEAEWKKGRLPGALHLCRGILERDIEAEAPDKRAEIVLYCGGGYRSALAADNLQKMGYRRVLSMRGGYRAWLAAGGKTVS